MRALTAALRTVADDVDRPSGTTPIETLRACGVTADQVSTPLSVEPSGAITMEEKSATTEGRIIKGGASPYAAVLQGTLTDLSVRQTEPFGPAFVVQTSDKTPPGKVTVFVSDRSGNKLFIPVTRKWPRGSKKHAPGRIPRHLLAFCNVGGQRRLCAVPTDVEDVRIHRGGRAQGIAVAAVWRGISEFGTIACAVRRDVLPDRVYGVSCRHVLSLSATFFDTTTWGAQVQVQTGAAAPTIGLTRAIAGRLGVADSFDAQFVEATNREALQAALGRVMPVRYARGVADLPARYDIHTPTGTIEAAFVDFPPEPAYDVGGHTIGHRTIVQSQPEEGTNPGTSGSPVISKDGRMLLGMHVAGKAEIDPQGHFIAVSYMIPAWELLKPTNYVNAGNQEAWSLVTP